VAVDTLASRATSRMVRAMGEVKTSAER